MLNLVKYFQIIFFSLLILIFVFPRQANAIVLFQDNFSDNDINSVLGRWEVPRNTCTGDWVLKEGKIGIRITSNFCQTEFTPKDSVWGGWNDYIFETDVTFTTGTDKNIAFRYSGSPNFDWYDYHFQVGPNDSRVVLERVFNVINNSNETRYPAINGNTYHLKIIVNGNNIVLYIDDNLVLDYPDAGNRFNTGKIALRAGTGADTPTEVYFDNVVVSSIDPPAAAPDSPIVILPGLTGSWCTNAIISGNDCTTSWTALPEPLDPYDSLIYSIENASDIDENNVHTWYYDWRKPISTLADQFNTFIENTVLSGKPANTKVRLVGHSYGGLIATKYTQNHQAKVEKIITSGSPHQGSVKAYGLWEAGNIWDTSVWEKISINLLLTSHENLFQTHKDIIRSEIPSIGEVLPTFDYLLNQNNQTITESSMNQRNTNLANQYSGLPSISSLLTTITGKENVSGDTISQIKVKSQNWIQQALGLWEDGAPDEIFRSTEGDLTVLRSSGRYDSASSTPEVTATHAGLISETSGINEILSALGSADSAQITDNPMNDQQGHAAFFLRSPAAISVQFNGQTYSDSDNDGLVVLENIGSGTAIVNLTGTGDGTYHLDVLQFHPNGDQSNTYSDSITVGQTQAIEVFLNPSTLTLNPIQDSTGEYYLSLANHLLDDIENHINSLAGRDRAKNILLRYVSSAKRSAGRAISNINNPSRSIRDTQSALLIIHRLRTTLNTYESYNHLSGSDITQIRRLSQNTIDHLQSAYAILSSRTGRNVSSFRLNSFVTLINRMENSVNQRGQSASRGTIPGALATMAAADNKNQANSTENSHEKYINLFSARLYLQEATRILK